LERGSWLEAGVFAFADPQEGAKGRAAIGKKFLRHDSQARVAFIDKVAAPVLNKMFECG